MSLLLICQTVNDRTRCHLSIFTFNPQYKVLGKSRRQASVIIAVAGRLSVVGSNISCDSSCSRHSITSWVWKDKRCAQMVLVWPQGEVTAVWYQCCFQLHTFVCVGGCPRCIFPLSWKCVAGRGQRGPSLCRH